METQLQPVERPSSRPVRRERQRIAEATNRQKVAVLLAGIERRLSFD